MSNRITEQAAAMAARCRPSTATPHISTCEHTLRIGFFFDGFDSIRGLILAMNTDTSLNS